MLKKMITLNLVLIGLLATVVVGRGSLAQADLNNLTSTPLPTPTTATKLVAGRALWESQNLTDYEYWLTEETVWNSERRFVRVQNGMPTAYGVYCFQGMAGGPCGVNPIRVDRLTMDGLYDRFAREFSEYGAMDYHPRVGFPVSASYNDPNVYDEEWFMNVTDFSSKATTFDLRETILSVENGGHYDNFPTPTLQPSTSPPTPTLGVTPTSPLPLPVEVEIPQFLDQSDWERQNLSDYRIRLRLMGQGVEQMVDMRVKNGLVKNLYVECVPLNDEPCTIRGFSPWQYQVDGDNGAGLFNLAQQGLFDKKVESVVLAQGMGYPYQIIFNDAAIENGALSVEVIFVIRLDY